jgi:hypothetical protein
MKSQNKIILGLILVFLTMNIFFVAGNHFVQAQADPLFNDNFDIEQPNSQFAYGSNDTLDNANYASPTHSLLVSPESLQYSRANFSDTSGQIYIQILYETSLPSYSRIITLQGETAWISIYEDEYGIWIDWNYDGFFTNTPLIPDLWYNITISLYLDPNESSNSSLNMWLNETSIADLNMVQLDGYSINAIVFEPNYVSDSFNNYDDVIISTQPFISPTPSVSPTPSPSPTPSSTSSPTPSPTETSTPTLTSSPTLTEPLTPSPSSKQPQTASASPFEFLPFLAIAVIIGATLSTFILYFKFKGKIKITKR